MAIDAGVNFFDTTNVYSYGQSEEILGKALKEKRNEIVLATKIRGRMSKDINYVGLSRKHIIESCNNSLKRLGTDYIDLYVMHSFDPIEKFVSLQALYSLISRDVEYELTPLLEDQGLGLTLWSPLGGGFLSGKYRKDKPMPEDSRRANEQQNFIPVDLEKGYVIVDAREKIANNHNASISQAALNYLLRKPLVSSVLVGATKPHQLEDNHKATEWEMSVDEVSRLDELSKLNPIYPHWMLQFTYMDRTSAENFF